MNVPQWITLVGWVLAVPLWATLWWSSKAGPRAKEPRWVRVTNRAITPSLWRRAKEPRAEAAQVSLRGPQVIDERENGWAWWPSPEVGSTTKMLTDDADRWGWAPGDTILWRTWNGYAQGTITKVSSEYIGATLNSVAEIIITKKGT